MKTTNNTIFENIHERGCMTEKEMILLKSRSNKAQKDLFLCDEFNEYIPLSEEWANKGLQWLKSLLKKNGEPKAGQNLGYREIEIIKILHLFASMTTATDGIKTMCRFIMWQVWNISYLVEISR